MNYKILRHFLSNLKRYLSTKTDSCKDMYTLQNNVHGVLEVLRLPKVSIKNFTPNLTTNVVTSNFFSINHPTSV